MLHGAASHAHTPALLCSDTDGGAEPLGVPQLLLGLAQLHSAIFLLSLLFALVPLRRLRLRGQPLEGGGQPLAGGGSVCGSGTGQGVEKRGGKGCGVKPV